MFFIIRKILKLLFLLIILLSIGVCFWYLKPRFQAYYSNQGGTTLVKFEKTFQDIQTAGTGFIDSIKRTTSIVAAKPCSAPIVYSLGTFDTRFGISQKQFLADIDRAAKIWETPLGKKLFQYASTTSSNNLNINLLYDYRQQATDAMSSVGSSIDSETSIYKSLKVKYDTLTASYATQKTALASIVASFQTAQNSYNQQVDYWNSRGGAPSDQYAALSQEKSNLAVQAQTISEGESALNTLANTINSTSAIINQYVQVLNSQAKQYNSISSSTGDEFEEGQYVMDSSGIRIDIFQYSTNDKLVRLLAHELGHSLGLEHIQNNPQAIMYPLNQGNKLSATADDIAALQKICAVGSTK